MEQEEKQERGLSHSAVDAITSVGIFAIGVVMMVDNYKIGAGWAKDGPESGYFPFRIGVILCIASIAVLLMALFAAIVLWMVSNGWLSLADRATTAWIVLTMLGLVLGIGMSWAHIRQRISGQASVDRVDHGR